MFTDVIILAGGFGERLWPASRPDYPKQFLSLGSGFSLLQFFLRFVSIFTIYKLYDMICFDYFLLMKFQLFQYYYPEVKSVYSGRKYGYNIKSQLLKLFVIFPAASALSAWVCTLF